MNDDKACLFCRIAAGEIASHSVCASSEVVAFLDIHPIRTGHVLVVPRRHFAYFDALPAEVANETLAVGRRLAPVLRRLFGVERVAFFFTGTDIAHAHAHVVPLVEPTDVTSRRYIAEADLTFRSAPLAAADELARTAAAIAAALT